MQIKNKLFLITLCVLKLFFFTINVLADEFNISAIEVSVDKENNIIIGKGDVIVTDSEGKIINSEKATYEKTKETLTAIGSVNVLDAEGNNLKTNKAIYDKIKNIIYTYGNTNIFLQGGYQLKSANIIYDNNKKIISSNEDSVFTDVDGNIVTVSMFRYHIEKNLFSSLGKIKIIDMQKNKYFFKELHVDVKKKEMIGSDVSAVLDKESFGVNSENDPRFVANDIFISKNKTNLSKGVFTICQKKEGKCPPWSIKAKKISHDKIKKTIYYENAVLRVYDIPIFYFPKFLHPDPTVKRSSGFLAPFFTSSSTVGSGVGLPYYWAISENKDLTFTPKVYAKENILMLNEFRQAFKNGFLTLDTSYTEGHKNTSATKTDGSRNHIFAELDLNFSENKSYDSDFFLKIQKVSNDKYFKKHDINTSLVNSENTDLKNEIGYKFSKNDTYFSISSNAYENLDEKTNSKYEYILPNIIVGKTLFNEGFGTIELKSNSLYKNFEVDKHLTSVSNDFIWNSPNYITKKGFVSVFEGQVNNFNYDAKNTGDYKTEGTVNEISSVLKYKSSLPLKKEDTFFSKIFSPTFMLRYAPGHMKNLKNESSSLKYGNLYSINKTSVIEDGLSAIIGFDYKLNEKNNDGNSKEKLSFSLGQIFNYKKNERMPTKTSLNNERSDVVGEFNYNFSDTGKIDYKFSVDKNLSTLNYNEVSTSLNFGKIDFNLDYLEEQDHIGRENYLTTGIDLNINDQNKLSFATKKNFKTESTEFYDISYQYMIDCLTAGLVYRREFYEDSETDEKDTLMFTISFIPITGLKSPALYP